MNAVEFPVGCYFVLYNVNMHIFSVQKALKYFFVFVPVGCYFVLYYVNMNIFSVQKALKYFFVFVYPKSILKKRREIVDLYGYA